LVYNKEIIAFAVIGEEQMIDLIPLAEVKSITPFGADEHLGENEVPDGASVNALQIETNQEGYNSG
jgi:hypothetical protein